MCYLGESYKYLYVLDSNFESTLHDISEYAFGFGIHLQMYVAPQITHIKLVLKKNTIISICFQAKICEILISNHQLETRDFNLW